MTQLKVEGNVPQMSVGEVVENLSEIYSSFILTNTPKDKMPSVMLWGPPGVGKSQAVHEIGHEIEKRTGKKCIPNDVRLLLFNPIDLRGIPVAEKDKDEAKWLMPAIFKEMDPSDDIVNILFLDEISAAPPSVQAAAYQLTLDRKVGEHKLPSNCIVIAAGNRVKDQSVAFKMPKALANRLLHIDVIASFNSWEKWAVQNGINDKVISFLEKRSDKFMCFDSGVDELAFATPRAWELVSNVLNASQKGVKDNIKLISGIVGNGTATEFKAFCQVYNEMPNIDDIFKDGDAKVPKKEDAQYAVVSAMAAYAREHKEDHEQIANSLAYAYNLPNEFALILTRLYQNLGENYNEILMSIPEWQDLSHKVGGSLNG